jgi:heme iron utilization protein
MTHEPRLTIALRTLLDTQRVAALGTLGEDGHAFVSMVPFAIDGSSGNLVIHVSGLAPHARNLERTPRVSLLVPGSADWSTARVAYLERFPEVEYMTQLGDFRFVAVAVTGARQVAGFGAARPVDAQELAQVLRKPG